CRDSKNPSGFYSFSLATDGSGHAFTQSYCYSGDGPDHWVFANGVESNHVSWIAPAPPANAPPPPGGGASPQPQQGGGGASGSSSQGGNSPASEQCRSYAGDRISGSGVAYALYDHYMWGNGRPVVIDWSYFASDSRFTGFARKLAVG